jgi:hypothetical protein
MQAFSGEFWKFSLGWTRRANSLFTAIRAETVHTGERVRRDPGGDGKDKADMPRRQAASEKQSAISGP